MALPGFKHQWGQPGQMTDTLMGISIRHQCTGPCLQPLARAWLQPWLCGRPSDKPSSAGQARAGGGGGGTSRGAVSSPSVQHQCPGLR